MSFTAQIRQPDTVNYYSLIFYLISYAISINNIYLSTDS